jgi:tetratricopeptide (TPR) repeat protein
MAVSGRTLLQLLLFIGLAGATAARAQWSVDLQKCADGGFMGLDLAIDYCTRAIKSGTLSDRSLANAYYNRAVAWERKRRYDRAITDLDEAVRLQAIRPEESGVRAGIYAARGGIKLTRHDYAGALADLDEALRLDPGRAEINVRRGQVWLAKGDPDKALQDFGTALRGSVTDQTQYSGVGIAYAGRPPNLDRTATDSAAHLGRALAYMQKADAESALTALGEGIRINPGNPALFAHRASLRARSGDYDGAIADYTAALRLNPRDVYGYHNRGCVWAAKREFANALLDMDAALSIDRSNEMVHSSRALLAAGEPCKR